MMFPTSMFPAAVRRTLSCAGLALAATLFPACGGGGAGGAGAPDNEGPASRLVLEGYETDRLLSRRGDIPLQYRGEVPADLTIRAWLDEDGDLATTDDRFGLLDNLPHPTDGRRLVFADAVFFQDISFHLLLTAGDPADGIYSMSRGRVRFANTAFARAIGEMDVSRMIVRTAVTPDGRISTVVGSTSQPGSRGRISRDSAS